MIDLLAQAPARRRFAVLGEMLELGRVSEALHRRVGAYAARHGVDVLIGVQGQAQAMVEAARAAGAVQTRFFAGPAEAGVFVRGLARAGDTVLFKGSRGVRMERAFDEFQSEGQDEPAQEQGRP